MNKNDYAHNWKTPYKLIDTDGKIGCYEDSDTARAIGRSTKKWFQVIHYKRGVVDEG